MHFIPSTRNNGQYAADAEDTARLKVLQEKYATTKKTQQETMRLYKENKVNPAAGCLPLSGQLPILILLFNVLRSYDFAGTSFFRDNTGLITTEALRRRWV
jgi:YidC/Oxa1 family membrane protein insertase